MAKLKSKPSPVPPTCPQVGAPQPEPSRQAVASDLFLELMRSQIRATPATPAGAESIRSAAPIIADLAAQCADALATRLSIPF